MVRIDTDSGIRLMRCWGIDNWPELEADYYVWGGCGVCALVDFGDVIELHMAMRKGDRCHSRTFVRNILNICNKPIRALIEEKNKHVCNLALKMGFDYVDFYPSEMYDGTFKMVIEMRNDQWDLLGR